MPEVRLAHHLEITRLSAVLARSFAEDPVSLAIFPDAADRPARLERFFGFQLTHNYLPRGEVYTTDELCAVAMWLPPELAPVRGRDRLANGTLVGLLGRRYLWTRRLATMLVAHHPRVPHYYLGILGTDPERQRQGLATALLGGVLERCDTSGVPAYLECSRQENIAFYARFGFSVREEVLAGRDGPRLWLMDRAPRPDGLSPRR